MSCRIPRRIIGAISLACFTGAVSLPAHETGSPGVWPSLWSEWSFEPGVVIPMAVAAMAYSVGLRRMPPRYQREALLFFGGWLMLALALISPIHRLGSSLFLAHMLQHELLMIAAAPLIVLGRPGLVMLRALPAGLARRVTHGMEVAHLAALWRGLTHPAVAWFVHALALWAWHIPSWFDATLRHEWIHAAQHLSFFGTGLWFWSSVFRGPRRAADYGWGVLNLFLTALHSSVLGALITFAPRPWYDSYTTTAPHWGLTGLEDQQLGGLVMWIPGGLMYMSVALALFVTWLHSDRTRTASAAEPAFRSAHHSSSPSLL